MTSLQAQRTGVAGSTRESARGPIFLGRGLRMATGLGSKRAAFGPAMASRSRRAAKVQAVIEAPAVRYEPATRAKTNSVLSIILGGGAGTRLYPLTKQRAKPAVPIGGAYRLIDVPMSNCINSGISKIYILTQFNSMSLNRHLARAYNMGSGVRFGGDGFVEVLAATQTPTDKEWFQGTADAVRQYSWLLEDTKNRSIEDVVILSGDHLYRMDYMKFVNYHRDTGADITIGAIPYSADRAKDFGLMKIDERRRIQSFAEKPKTEEALNAMRVDTTVLGLTPEEAAAKPFLASMGIYVFKKDALLKLLNETCDSANDFGGEIIPQAAELGLNVMAYPFYGYWEDIGTIKSFFEENLKLCRHPAAFEFYDPMSPIYTSPRVLPPASVQRSKIVDAIISQGSFVSEATITNAVIGIRSIIKKNVTIQDAMVFGADFYESESSIQACTAANPPVGIGENSFITNAIIEKNCRIGKNVKIMNKEGISEATHADKGIYIRSGIVVLDKGTAVPDGTVI